MIFEEYYKKYLKLKKVKKEINKLETKKIALIAMVNIQVIPPREVTGVSNSKEDKMLIYTAELEEVETNLEKNRFLLNELLKQIVIKEEELRKSDEELDKVYLYKYIDKLKWYQICPRIGYEKTKTYDLINEVDENLSKIEIAEKNGNL